MNKKVIILTVSLLFCLGLLGCAKFISDKNTGRPQAAPSPAVSNPADQKSQNPTGGEALPSPEVSNETGKQPSNPQSDEPVPPPNGTAEMKTDSGKYTGRADSNFIEIQFGGGPDGENFRVFMLSQELKEKFDELGLESGQNVTFDYFVNENKQNVIVKIEKI